MFLSNLRKYFLFVSSFALIFQACGSSQTNENKPAQIKVEAKSEFPFSTKEPEIYQGDFVAGDAIHQDRWFVARKGDKSRIDYFADGAMVRSQIINDRLFLIDHKKKTFAAAASSGSDASVFGAMTQNFFGGKEYRDFEEVSRNDGLITYKVRNSPTAKGEILIDIDTRSGMIVRQEFTSAGDPPIKFVYEIKNFRTDVDDAVFAIPVGYREVVDIRKKSK